MPGNGGCSVKHLARVSSCWILFSEALEVEVWWASQWVKWASQWVKWASQWVKWASQWVKWASQWVKWASQWVKWASQWVKWVNPCSKWGSPCSKWVNPCSKWVNPWEDNPWADKPLSEPRALWVVPSVGRRLHLHPLAARPHRPSVELQAGTMSIMDWDVSLCSLAVGVLAQNWISNLVIINRMIYLCWSIIPCFLSLTGMLWQDDSITFVPRVKCCQQNYVVLSTVNKLHLGMILVIVGTIAHTSVLESQHTARYGRWLRCFSSASWFGFWRPWRFLCTFQVCHIAHSGFCFTFPSGGATASPFGSAGASPSPFGGWGTWWLEVDNIAGFWMILESISKRFHQNGTQVSEWHTEQEGQQRLHLEEEATMFEDFSHKLVEVREKWRAP